MTKQAEASVAARRAVLFKKVAAVIDQMPDHFQARDLCKLAGIKPVQTNYWILARILEQDFKCWQSGFTSHNRTWRKPNDHTTTSRP